VVGYHPRRGAHYDSCEDRSPTPEPPGTRVFSREIRTASFPQRFRQPTSIDKYTGETAPCVWLNDNRLACQLGGVTTDEVIIRNLPLHLADSARMWLEHLPANQIHNWDDLVRTFVGTSRARMCALGTPGTCSCAPRSPASRSGTSYGASPSAALSSRAWLSPRSCTPSSRARLYTVNSCIKVRLDLQADKSPVVVKGPFFPLVVNPRYRICGTNV
jgi:hypothetical protein